MAIVSRAIAEAEIKAANAYFEENENATRYVSSRTLSPTSDALFWIRKFGCDAELDANGKLVMKKKGI